MAPAWGAKKGVEKYHEEKRARIAEYLLCSAREPEGSTNRDYARLILFELLGKEKHRAVLSYLERNQKNDREKAKKLVEDKLTLS